MLKGASFTNLTSVPAGDWKFSPGLNIIVGENGLGKSHVLKCIYSVLKALNAGHRASELSNAASLDKAQLERHIVEELVGNMRPDNLGRLVKRRQGRNRAEVSLSFKKKALNTRFGFATNSQKRVEFTRAPKVQLKKPPVYIPTRELITLCPWFVPLYDGYTVPFEKSWRDTVQLLGAPSLRGPRAAKLNDFLTPIEHALHGKVVVDTNGRFFLKTSDGMMEAALVAEGLRKLAMLARLISTGVLLEQGYLFWDEPETNLNPKLIKVLAKVIVDLSSQGIQIFLATHSTFLLREISIICVQEPEVDVRYFALSASGNDDVSVLEQGSSVDELDTLVLLDEELSQSSRYMDLN